MRKLVACDLFNHCMLQFFCHCFAEKRHLSIRLEQSLVDFSTVVFSAFSSIKKYFNFNHKNITIIYYYYYIFLAGYHYYNLHYIFIFTIVRLLLSPPTVTANTTKIYTVYLQVGMDTSYCST